MKILFINAAFRSGTRTGRLAEAYLKQCGGELCEIDLGSAAVPPLDAKSLAVYNRSVAAHRFEDAMFDFAKQFAQADQIVIAAPFWNFSIPAVLHCYLELVCTQGLTFDLNPDGSYRSLCRAKKLTYITTAGGHLPQDDHAFGYIKTLTEVFWHIPEVQYIKADGLDIYGTDVEQKLAEAMEQTV